MTIRAWRAVIMMSVGLLSWVGTVSGDALDPHDLIQRMEPAYQAVTDYTALFLQRERIRGTLEPLSTIDFRFQAPFKIYMSWHSPNPGRTVVYIEGENNNEIQVNPGGLLKMMRLSLDPTGRLATRNSHHTIRQAGLGNLINLILTQYRRGMQAGQMTLRALEDDKVDGRPAYRLALLCHADQTAGYYAKRANIWIDKAHYLPTRLQVYNWNDQLYAHYEYRHLKLNPGLSPADFKLTPTELVPPVAADSEADG